MATVRTLRNWPMRVISSVTCTQSSRVGVRISAWTWALDGSIFSTIGMAKAAVLPVPVCAWPIRSSPRRSGGMPRAWTSVGVTKPIFSMARAMVAGTSISPNRYARDAAMTACSNSEGADGSLATSIATWSAELLCGRGRAPAATGLRARGIGIGQRSSGEGGSGRWRRARGRARTGAVGALARRSIDPVGDAAPAMLPRHPRPHRDGARPAGRPRRAAPRAADAAAAGAPASRGWG